MKYETYLDANSEWRWTLFADNGRKIANSGEGYKNYSDCLHAINLVKGSADVPVVQRGLGNALRNALSTNGGTDSSENKLLRNALAGRRKSG